MKKKRDTVPEEGKKLADEVREARTSLSFLCETCGLSRRTGRDASFLKTLSAALKAVEDDLATLLKNPESSSRFKSLLDEAPDSVDLLNRLNSDFLESASCASAIWKTISSSLKIQAKSASREAISSLRMKAAHAQRLMSSADRILAGYASLLESRCGGEGIPRLSPPGRLETSHGTRSFLDLDIKSLPDGDLLDRLAGIEDSSEDEPGRKVLRRSEGDFVEVALDKPRPVEKFFGYPTARTFFRKYLRSFAEGRENSPLLITSLPGLGKTHFTISFTFAMPNLTLILCEPGDLEKPLEKAIGELSLRPNRRFVMFFDDVDTRKINWYYFRTHVGGTFNLPPNILVVIASNYEFPANISSRGRCFSFPLFDEINCMEMVHDYLVSVGMKSPSKELVSVIAADYVEEYGQRVFEELSPRTLVRYLDKFGADTQKRIKLLNISHDKVVPMPEAALFYETNQKVIQRLKESV